MPVLIYDRNRKHKVEDATVRYCLQFGLLYQYFGIRLGYTLSRIHSYSDDLTDKDSPHSGSYARLAGSVIGEIISSSYGSTLLVNGRTWQDIE